MTRWDAEAAVVGLGAWGASALWKLAARGVDVVGFERFTPGHSLGSSHGGARMFRLAALEHPRLVPLAQRSRELWSELEDAAQEQLFVPTGGLLIGPENGHIAGGTLRSAREHGIDVRTFTARALRFQYPRHTAVPDHHIGVWEPTAGIVRPERAVRSAVALARRAGARVYTDTRITSIEPVPGGVLLHTAQRTVRVRQVVVTAGSWLASLVPGLPLETVRMPITWFRQLEPDDSFTLDSFPVFMRELDDVRVLRGSGMEGGHDIQLSLEDRGVSAKPIDPDDSDRSVASEDWSDLAAMLPAKVPGLEAVPARVAVCMATRTPDGQFVIGRPGGDPRVIVAGGDNAHGFQHATGIGEALADLVQSRPTRVPLDFLSPDRFA
ncbi:N-methyl-L-tryptophan oxidase [Streptomyces sp. NBC_00322]|uniref:N-methyl-L-tryptophan oxidase n=1 Tax=Streptomyces sp. NBC_00322 TaxID=2975712 RepID=UPI002E2AD578|nr:N-methyl-L-tryptophan oxidase [Streptomyces sp. NBC_00322]